MITLDTSGLLARIRQQDRYHAACRAALESDRGPYIIPAGILGEIAWMLESILPPAIEQAFLDDLREEAYTLDWEPRDIARIQQLAQKYQDLPLGLSAAMVITCAERNGGHVLTTDRRHFDVVARGEKTITILPGQS